MHNPEEVGDPSPEEEIGQLLRRLEIPLIETEVDDAKMKLELGEVSYLGGSYYQAREYYLRAKEVFGRLGMLEDVADCDVLLGHAKRGLRKGYQAGENCLRARE